jgi:hypothetical protein
MAKAISKRFNNPDLKVGVNPIIEQTALAMKIL